MPRSEDKNKLLRESQSLKILDAARKVFTRKGWSATMADVASAAEISQGLAYRYFASKEAIFNKLIEQAVQSNSATLQLIKEMPCTPRERLEALVSRILSNKREHIENYQLSVMIQNDNAAPNNIREFLFNQGKTYINAMRELIIEGQATGEIAKGNPVQMAIAIAACLDGLSRFALHNSEQLKEHFPDVEIILRMLKP